MSQTFQNKSPQRSLYVNKKLGLGLVFQNKSPKSLETQDEAVKVCSAANFICVFQFKTYRSCANNRWKNMHVINFGIYYRNVIM